MTLNLSENSWAKTGLITALVLLVIGVWAYMAGGIFLMVFDHKFEEATPLTLYQYWYYYGTEKQVLKWLYISSGIGLALLLAPFIVFFAPAKKSLFGDARFATQREIKKAGLLGEKGLIVGKLGNKYLTFDGPTTRYYFCADAKREGRGYRHSKPLELAGQCRGTGH